MKPTLPEVLPLVRAVYQRHVAGCCLHILTDDGNVGDDDAQFCLNKARDSNHADCIAAAEMLVRMSRTQRRKVAAMPKTEKTK